MKFDATITISIIIGLVATLPQIIVAFINNHYQIIIKENENYKLAKRNAIEEFIDTASQCCNSQLSLSQISSYEKSFNKLKLYIDNIDTKMFDKLKSSRNNSNIEIYYKNLSEIITYLAQFVDKK